jgi:hypothetical protein
MPQKGVSPRSHGGDGAVPGAPSTNRLDRMEAALESIQETLDVQFMRLAAMQAEIDLLRAKRRSS